MKSIVILYVACVVYAVVRYAVFVPKNWENLPVFIVNKGVAMGAAIAFTLALWGLVRGRLGGAPGVWGAEAAAWFRAGVFGAICHVPISIAILEPAYFKEFFVTVDPAAFAATGIGPRMSFAGEMVFILGGLAAGTLYLITRQTWSARARWWLNVTFATVLTGHVLMMGYNRGVNINASHAYLPPMWLLSAIAGGIGIVMAVRLRGGSDQELKR